MHYSFGDYLSNNKIDTDDRQTDRQTDRKEDLVFPILGVKKRKENMKVASRRMDSIANGNTNILQRTVVNKA